jgi:tribbles-like protein
MQTFEANQGTTLKIESRGFNSGLKLTVKRSFEESNTFWKAKEVVEEVEAKKASSMNSAAVTPRDFGPRPPSLFNISTLKDKTSLGDLSLGSLVNGATLSPDVKCPGFAPDFSSSTAQHQQQSVECIGKYLLLEKVSSAPLVETRRAVHLGSQEEFLCKIFPLDKYRDILAPYWQSGFHRHIADIVEILLGKTQAYVIFSRSYEDLHSYIRKKRRLKEPEAAELFAQIISAIKHCHRRGIVLRDLKLRKFVFADQQRSHLILDGLEDAFLLPDQSDDHLTDKHGCPAYVSPEILSSSGYSGKSADMWSLGVILYTMLFGQYPFHDTVASQLFGKIRRGHYTVPDNVSASARSLIKSLLRTEPTERLTIEEACRHPWFEHCQSRGLMSQQSALFATSVTASKSNVVMATRDSEQKVPDVVLSSSQDCFFSSV